MSSIPADPYGSMNSDRQLPASSDPATKSIDKGATHRNYTGDEMMDQHITNSSMLGLPQGVATENILHSTLLKKSLATAAVGLLAIFLAIVGLFMFLTSDYFHDPGPYPYNSWQGYTKYSFTGLMLFMFCAPPGFCLTYTGSQALARWKGPIGMYCFTLFGAACVVVGCAGMVWGQETMQCLGVFCVGSAEKWKEVPNARPEAGIGFLSTIGMSAFFSLIPMGAIIFIQGLRFLKASTAGEDTPLLDGPKRGSRHIFNVVEDTTRVYMIAIGAFVACFFFMVFTFYIPNSWEYFTAARIAKNARLQISRNATLCNVDWQTTTCPEVEWATFFTSTVKVSEHLILKAYPGNKFFFSYLLTLVVIVAVIRGQKEGRKILKKHVAFGFTIGEVALVLATILMMSCFFHYWIHDHNYNGYWVGGRNRGLTDSERWARALGQLAVVFMGLLFFPASRNSVMHKLFGTSWEASLWAHRVLGYAMLLATFGHMIAWYVKYGQMHLLPQDIFEVPMSLPTSIDNFTVPMNTLTTWMMFVAMGFLTYEPIRRRFFEVFYYSHIIAAYCAIPAVLWHAAAGWEYLLPGVTVWFIDRLLRLYRSSAVVDIQSIRAHSGVTEIKFLQPSMTLSPGQYVFVNIPEISLFEWHPFTISSGIGSSTFSLHIKSMGVGTWTDRLLEIAIRGNAHITLAVDGPYGHPIPYDDYKRVLLCAGGIGITPCASIFSGLKDCDNIHANLIWSLREHTLIEAFAEQLGTPGRPQQSEEAKTDVSMQSLDPNGNPINQSLAKVFFTRNERGSAVEYSTAVEGAQLACGRPSYEFEFSEIGRGVEPQDVLVFVCGPQRMVDDCRQMAIERGYNFHQETFLL